MYFLLCQQKPSEGKCKFGKIIKFSVNKRIHGLPFQFYVSLQIKCYINFFWVGEETHSSKPNK